MHTEECRKKIDDLRKHLKQIRFNPDLYKLYANLENMIKNISNIEVDCRRTKNYRLINKPLEDFNNAADRLEKLILIARLID